MSIDKLTDIHIPITETSTAIMHCEERCIECGACKRICEGDIAAGRLYDTESTGEPICAHCGKRANACPWTPLQSSAKPRRKP